LAQGCDYEESPTGTGLNRGVKQDSKYYTRTTAGQPNWTLSQTDTYSYDPQLDYLTGATYGDGLANASPTWSYDAAANRTDTIVDNLNRPTSIGGVAVGSDVLGNRLTMGSNSYTWDLQNRMTSYKSTSCAYRADGTRVSKSNSTGSTSYRYDAQMGMEDIDFAANGSVSKVTDYGIGAREIAYPLYDAHGSMMSTLAEQGAGGYTFSTPRTFDAWGNLRLGALTGDPKGRYCAELGHKQDDESGLTYMRARYYEPTSGRFLSEDPQRSSENWFEYCGGDPVQGADRTGCTKVDDDTQHQVLFILDENIWLGGSVLAGLFALERNLNGVVLGLTIAIAGAAAALGETDFSHGLLFLINMPAAIAVAIFAYAASLETAASNACTFAIVGLLTASFTADTAALLTVDG
jgi:RHS repeat-associated protein